MDLVWARQGPLAVGDVLAGLNAGRESPLAYTTVLTILSRLYGKGRLAREPQGRAFLYRAVETKDAYTARVMTEALGGSADRHAALVQFLEQLGPEDAAALRQLLGERREQGA